MPTYSLDELKKMPAGKVNVILGKAKIRGTAVIRRADGSIKYDNQEKFEEAVRKQKEELENER